MSDQKKETLFVEVKTFSDVHHPTDQSLLTITMGDDLETGGTILGTFVFESHPRQEGDVAHYATMLAEVVHHDKALAYVARTAAAHMAVLHTTRTSPSGACGVVLGLGRRLNPVYWDEKAEWLWVEDHAKHVARTSDWLTDGTARLMDDGWQIREKHS